MLFNAWQEQGFKGKQMVVKPSCNNRLHCVQCVFFCGTAVGKLRMITKPSGLLVFLNTFGVQKQKDHKKKFHPTEAIAISVRTVR